VQVSASRRDIANIKDAELKAYYGDQQIKAAELAGQNWKNSQTAGGKSRLGEGAGLLPRHMEEQAKRAEFAAMFSGKALRIRSELAALTGRKMTYAAYAGQSAKNLLEASMNERSEANLSRQAGGPSLGLPFPGLSSVEGRDTGTKVPGILGSSSKPHNVDADN
jgi:hypothetical protein